MRSVSRASLDNLIGFKKRGENSLGRMLQHRSVRRFHDSFSALSGSSGTEAVYLSAIQAICKYSSKAPDELVDLLSKAPESKITDILQGFVNAMVEQGKAPKTVQAYLSAVNGFLEVNDVEVPPLRRRVRKPRVYVRSADRAPTIDELRTVCVNADPETRALLLFLLSSGCRIGEALMVERGDFDLREGTHVVKIRPETAKDRIGRLTFVTGEAFGAIEAYLKTHESSRVFPLSRPRAYHKLTIAFARTVTIRTTAGRKDVHPHSLRKFFFTTALRVLGREMAEALIGHKQYLDQAYRRLTVDEMATLYRRLEPSLTLFGQVSPARARNSQVVAKSDEVEHLISMGYEFEALLPNGRSILRAPTSPERRQEEPPSISGNVTHQAKWNDG